MIDNGEEDIPHEQYTKVDYKMYTCGHNAISRQYNHKDNNKICALSSDSAVDNCTKWVSLSDIGRTSSTYSKPPNISHNRLVTAPNLRSSEDSNQGNNQLKLISNVGTEESYNQVGHVPEASNISSHSIFGTRDHDTQEDDANDRGMQNSVLYNDHIDTNMITGVITVNMSAPSNYHQEDHIVNNSRHYHNLSRPHNGGHTKSNTIPSAKSIHGNSPEQGQDMISAITTGGYRGAHTWVGQILGEHSTDSQSNQVDNNMSNNPQGTGIHAVGKMSELAYEITPRKNRELWCTWASWAGGSSGPVNSTTGEEVR